MVGSEEKFKTLYDHYKETLLSIKETNKSRDRMFVLAILIVGALFFQFYLPQSSSSTISSFLSQKTGFFVSSNTNVINVILWFSLFAVILRYFQQVVTSERQYPYLHGLEGKINNLCEDSNFISKEGKSYLGNYPLFSDWIHWMYRAVFPLILIVVITIKIVSEWSSPEKIMISLIFNSVVFVCIAVTVSLYLCYLYYKK